LTTLTFDDLNKKYEEFTSRIAVEAVFATEMVGGQPADEEGIRGYVQHHLKISDPEEFEKTVKRIKNEEVQDTRPPEGELPEGKLYGLRAIRRDERQWPYAGDWMMKAAIKTSATRLMMFEHYRRLKGGIAEAGRIRGWKYSADPSHPNFIYLCDAHTDGPAKTYYKEFMGRVQSPQGAVSIIHWSECVPPGTRFAFEFNFIPVAGLREDDLHSLLSLLMIVGLGSARSLESGKFRIERAEVELNGPYKFKTEVKGSEIKV
jgi:hypothetical protein